MRKFFAIVGMLFCAAVIWFGVRFVNGEAATAPASASSAPSYYDSGYTKFGADFYTYVSNNAAEASAAIRQATTNQVRLFRLMTKFFGYVLMTLGGIGFCLFGILCCDPRVKLPKGEKVLSAAPAAPQPAQAAPAPQPTPAPAPVAPAPSAPAAPAPAPLPAAPQPEQKSWTVEEL